MGEVIRINHSPFMTAVGDGTQLLVDRSLAFSEQDTRYLPVRQYIEDLGLVLISTEVGPKPGMYGRVEQLHYGTPEVRQMYMMQRNGDLDD